MLKKILERCKSLELFSKITFMWNFCILNCNNILFFLSRYKIVMKLGINFKHTDLWSLPTVPRSFSLALPLSALCTEHKCQCWWMQRNNTKEGSKIVSTCWQFIKILLRQSGQSTVVMWFFCCLKIMGSLCAVVLFFPNNFHYQQ